MKDLDLNIIDNAAEVLVLCYTDTCNKCHFREWELSKLEDEITIPMWKYNAGNDAEFCKKYDITEVPVLILLESWRIVKKLSEIQNNAYVLTYFELIKWQEPSKD